MARIIQGLADDCRRLDERIERLSREIEAMARQAAGCERLTSVSGIWPIIASATMGTVQKSFRRANHPCFERGK